MYVSLESDLEFCIGIFLVSFTGCLRTLLWTEGHFKPLRMLNIKMIVACLLMFVIASLDVAFHLRHNLEAFIWYNGPAIENFNKTSSWINVVKMGCYVAQTFVGDSILVCKMSLELHPGIKFVSMMLKLFRCWVIYNRNWFVIVIPIVLWLGTTGNKRSWHLAITN